MRGKFEFSEQELALPRGFVFDPEAFLDESDTRIFGGFFEVIIREVLEKCGYSVTVYPNGHLNPPDLLVDSRPVEVKARTISRVEETPPRVEALIEIKEVDEYKKQFPEMKIVLCVPYGNYLYAQDLGRLDPLTKIKKWEPIERLFPLLGNLNEHFCRRIARKVSALFKNESFER